MFIPFQTLPYKIPKLASFFSLPLNFKALNFAPSNFRIKGRRNLMGNKLYKYLCRHSRSLRVHQWNFYSWSRELSSQGHPPSPIRLHWSPVSIPNPRCAWTPEEFIRRTIWYERGWNLNVSCTPAHRDTLRFHQPSNHSSRVATMGSKPMTSGIG